VRKPEERRLRREDNIKTGLKEIIWEAVNWINP